MKVVMTQNPQSQNPQFQAQNPYSMTPPQAAQPAGQYSAQQGQPHQGQADQERAACSRPGPGPAEGGTSAAHRRDRHCGPTIVSGSTAGMLPLGASKAIWTTSVSFLPDGP